MQIIAINATARNACITGDLPSAEELLTQEIDADFDNYSSYANRSFVMARNHDWDHALHDAIKVRHIGPLYGRTEFHGPLVPQHSALIDRLYLQGHCPLRKKALRGRNESIRPRFHVCEWRSKDQSFS